MICADLLEMQSLLAQIQEQEFASVEEMKEKLINIQELVNQAIENEC